MATDSIKFVTGEWLTAVESGGSLVAGEHYYVWASDPVNGIVRLSRRYGGGDPLPGSFTFDYLARATKKGYA